MLVYPSHIATTCFSVLPDVVVRGPGLQLQGLEADLIPEEEAITVFNLNVTMPEALWNRMCLHSFCKMDS